MLISVSCRFGTWPALLIIAGTNTIRCPEGINSLYSFINKILGFPLVIHIRIYLYVVIENVKVNNERWKMTAQECWILFRQPFSSNSCSKVNEASLFCLCCCWMTLYIPPRFSWTPWPECQINLRRFLSFVHDQDLFVWLIKFVKLEKLVWPADFIISLMAGVGRSRATISLFYDKLRTTSCNKSYLL